MLTLKELEIKHSNKLLRINKGSLLSMQEIIENYGGLEEFIREENNTDGTIEIQFYKKNGSTSVRDGLPVKINIKKTTHTQVVPTSAQHLNQHVPTSSQHLSQHAPTYANISPTSEPYLMGLNGLGFPQVMDMNSKAFDRDRLLEENRELKMKLQKLEEENYNLKDENLKNKYEVEKSLQNDELIKNIAGIVKGFLGKDTSQDDQGLKGLNGQELTSVQNEMIKLIVEQPSLAQIILDVSILLLNREKGALFYEQLIKIIKTATENGDKN